VVIGIVNLLLMTLAGEVVSKMLAARYAVLISRVIAGPLRAVYRVLRPVVEFVEAGVIAPLARLFSPGVSSGELTPDELGALLHLGAQEGAIDADEQRVLGQVIGLSGLRVREVMTPRVDLSWLEASAPLAEVQEMARVQGLTRIPICRGSIDDEDVLGLLDVKKYLAAAAAGKPVGLEECVDPPCYAPERASLDKLLELMRTRGVKLAICVNEHGSVTGVVSLQDLVRRLVAELDRQDEESIAGGQVRQVGAGEWEVPGRLSVGAWAGMFGLKADKRVSTVAGLIFARLGRTPEVGDSVVIGNVRLRVARLDGRVVESAFVDLVTDGALAGGGA
jgi:putative hemolysin